MDFSPTYANSISSNYFDKTITEIAFEDSVLYNKLKEKNKIKRRGGNKIQIPIEYTQYNNNYSTGTHGAVASTVSVVRSTQETIASSTHDWKYYFSSVRITWAERTLNVGTPAIVDLIKLKTKQLTKGLTESIIDDLFDVSYDTTAAATVDTSDQYQIDSLNKMINVEAPVSGDVIYGGIDPTDMPSWVSTHDNHTTEMVLYPSDVTLSGEHSLSERFNDATFGTSHPTLFITTRDLFTKYESLLSPQQRYEDTKTANAGFTNLTFKGIPVVADAHCPAKYFYGIDMDVLEFMIHSDFDFNVTEWKALESYPNDLFKDLSMAGNMISRRRDTHFKFSALDASI